MNQIFQGVQPRARGGAGDMYKTTVPVGLEFYPTGNLTVLNQQGRRVRDDTLLQNAEGMNTTNMKQSDTLSNGMLQVVNQALQVNGPDNRLSNTSSIVVPQFVHKGNYRNFLAQRTYANFRRYTATKLLQAVKKLFNAAQQFRTTQASFNQKEIDRVDVDNVASNQINRHKQRLKNLYFNPLTQPIFTGADTAGNTSNRIAIEAATALTTQQAAPSRDNMTNLLRLVGARAQLQTQLNRNPAIRNLIAAAQAQGRLGRVVLGQARQAPERGFFQAFGGLTPAALQQRRPPARQAINLGDPFGLRASQRLMRRGVLQVGAMQNPPPGQLGALVTGLPVSQIPPPMMGRPPPMVVRGPMDVPPPSFVQGYANLPPVNAPPYSPFTPAMSQISSPYPEATTQSSLI